MLPVWFWSVVVIIHTRTPKPDTLLIIKIGPNLHLQPKLSGRTGGLGTLLKPLGLTRVQGPGFRGLGLLRGRFLVLQLGTFRSLRDFVLR